MVASKSTSGTMACGAGTLSFNEMESPSAQKRLGVCHS